jgi:hypothetical protein
MKLFNVVVFIFLVWLAHVLFLFVSHGTDSPHQSTGSRSHQGGAKHHILSQAREEYKIAEKLLTSFDTQESPSSLSSSTTSASASTSNHIKAEYNVGSHNSAMMSSSASTSSGSHDAISEALQEIQHSLAEEEEKHPKHKIYTKPTLKPPPMPPGVLRFCFPSLHSHCPPYINHLSLPPHHHSIPSSPNLLTPPPPLTHTHLLLLLLLLLL